MKEILFSDIARQKLAIGIQKLADAVSVTMGPSGKNVLLQKKYKSILTKDGVSVANDIILKDNIENIGASMIKEAANNAANESGDGTTTATVLANAIFQEGLRSVTAGANPNEIKKGMDICTNKILENLKLNSKEITTNLEIEQVATISANGDNAIGKMIAQALEQVGKDGVITVEEAKGIKDELNVVKGMQFNQGYLSPYFITDTSKLEVNLENSYILIMNQKLINLQEILPALQLTQEKKNSLLIICEDIESDALNTLVINKMRKIVDVVVVKAPGFSDNRRDYLQDIAILTGAKVIDKSADSILDKQATQLGTCEKIIVTKDKCTIVGGKGNLDSINERAESIKELLNKEDEEYFKGIFKERLAKLVGGVAVIKVSAPTDTETKERKDRIDDALGATRAAQAEGIIIGGGCALVKSLFDINDLNLENDQKIGAQIILKAIQAPISKIVENAGYNAGVVIDKVINSDIGYIEKYIGFDASKNEYVNMFEAGIIDAYKVCRVALTNAVSVSSMLLTTECIVSNIEDVK